MDKFKWKNNKIAGCSVKGEYEKLKPCLEMCRTDELHSFLNDMDHHVLK